MAINKKDRKLFIYDESGNLTKEVLLGYVYGELSPSVRLEVDKVIQENEFYRDAVEGLKAINDKTMAENILSGLNAQIGERSGATPIYSRKTNYIQYLRVAAIILVLALLGIVVTILIRTTGQDNDVIAEQINKTLPKEQLNVTQHNADNTLSDSMMASEDDLLLPIEETIAADIEPEEVLVATETLKSKKQPTAERQEQKQKQPQTAAGEALKPIDEFEEMNKDIAGLEPELSAGQEPGAPMNSLSNTTNANDKDVIITRRAKKEQTGAMDVELSDNIDAEPQFPGGQAALLQYIKENIKYPRSAKKQSVVGKVYVSFVIDTKGNVNNVKIIRGIREDLDNEAKRVVESMPRWKPGLKNGLPVSTDMNLPIEFNLAD